MQPPTEALETIAARRSSGGAWAVGVALVAALGVGGYFVVGKRAAPTRASTPVTTASAPSPRPVEPSPAVPTVPEPAAAPSSAVLDAATPVGGDAGLSSVDAPAPAPAAAEPSPAPPAPPAPVAAAPAPVEATPAPAPAAEPTPPAPQTARPAPTERAPRGYEALVSTGNRLLERGRPRDAREAEKLFLQALADRPGGVDALIGLAWALVATERYNAAIDRFKEVLSSVPGNGEAIMGLAQTYKMRGDKPRALEYYRRYLSEQPSGSKASMARKNIEMLESEAARDKPAPAPAPAAPSP
jgi:TolA-binding protein